MTVMMGAAAGAAYPLASAVAAAAGRPMPTDLPSAAVPLALLVLSAILIVTFVLRRAREKIGRKQHEYLRGLSPFAALAQRLEAAECLESVEEARLPPPPVPKKRRNRRSKAASAKKAEAEAEPEAEADDAADGATMIEMGEALDCTGTTGEAAAEELTPPKFEEELNIAAEPADAPNDDVDDEVCGHTGSPGVEPGVYTAGLLLLHREISQRIAAGAPGLERPAQASAEAAMLPCTKPAWAAAPRPAAYGHQHHYHQPHDARRWRHGAPAVPACA